jgi:hypothetical protein
MKIFNVFNRVNIFKKKKPNVIGVIIKYSDFYGKAIPKEPLDLIKHLPKDELIITISRINSFLNPQNSISIDDSYKTQIECIKTITDQDQKERARYYKSYENHYKKYFTKNHTLFTRTTCLYALNEIVCSDDFLIKEKQHIYLKKELEYLNIY